MLSWLFAVLALLNAGLFFWGYQREKSLEPPPMPVPEGRYEIRLIGEVTEESQQALIQDAPGAASLGEVLVDRRSGDAQAAGTSAAEDSGPRNEEISESNALTGSVSEAERNRSEPGSTDLQVDGSDLETEGVREPQLEESSATSSQPDIGEALEQTDPADSEVSETIAVETVAGTASESASPIHGEADPAKSSAEPVPRSEDGLRADELEVEAPTKPADIAETRPPVPSVEPEPSGHGSVGSVPQPSSEDGR